MPGASPPAPRRRSAARGRSAAPDSSAARRPSAARAQEHRARSLARRLALQALYQLQVNPRPWEEVQRQYAEDPQAQRADLDYFRELLASIAPNREALDAHLGRLCEIAPPELDPIEHAVLWLGLHELAACPQLPYRVVLAEAVQLAKQFGATAGHKFVNAVLDRGARELRLLEYGRPAE